MYHDVPTARLWSRLGAMYINEWYVPSVLLAWLFGHQGYVSGQTLCLRASTLRAIGGLRGAGEPSGRRLSDRRTGARAGTANRAVAVSWSRAEHHEPSYESLSRHEMRWMRTHARAAAVELSG